MICEEVVESNGAGLQNAFQENKAYTPSTLFPLLHFGVGKGYPAMAFVGFLNAIVCAREMCMGYVWIEVKALYTNLDVEYSLCFA